MEPMEPMHPVRPMDPMDPVDPVRPEGPSGPVVRVERVRPGDPIEPVDRVEPEHRMDPAEPAGPASYGLLVTRGTVESFARATGDVSPLHIDPAYARRTPFGEPVAHGVLAVLLALASGPPRPGRRLSRLRARFPAPVRLGRRYAVTVDETGAERTALRIHDGPRT
ncbi:MaoC/PaaZ C-terminal domain-containing protein, partial [Streptomyces sp. NPDC055078]